MRRVIANGNISLDPRLHVFAVAGTMEPHVVRLFPATSCSCPASSQCYHVLSHQSHAVTPQKEKHSPRADKTSGRKRPRQNDVDFLTAGDAVAEVAQQLAAAVTQSTTSTALQATAIGSSQSEHNYLIWTCISFEMNYIRQLILCHGLDFDFLL